MTDPRERLVKALDGFTNCPRNKVLAANKLFDEGWVNPVRCEDCQHWEDWGPDLGVGQGFMVCARHGDAEESDSYCSHGVPRSEGE